ncbi:MAG: xanthine dehydrogenase family protein molybdopterin-binding subunit, partial [Nitrososphaerota archaeon]|nr:xanthine dehydrogenase family protein molybdopterin-binding subunit [Nitrososphaerota archaeon]
MDIQPSDIGLSANTGMLYMGYVTCPYPNAIIKSIDTSAAEAMGAITLTALDYDFLPPNDYYSSSGLHTRGPLPWPQVRSPGQFVVAVAHTSPDLVNDAIQLVKVEYEPLPYVFDAVAALQPDAPQLWPNGNSPSGSVVEGQPTPSTAVVQFGNVDAAFAAADAVVNLPILDTQWINHFDFEPRGLIAQWTNAGTINIYCNSQYV